MIDKRIFFDPRKKTSEEVEVERTQTSDLVFGTHLDL